MADSEEARREKLLKVAAKLFGEHGYHHTRMAEIAKAARVSPKMLYKYFGSKKELFLSVREWTVNRLIRNVLVNMPEQRGDIDSWELYKEVLRTYMRFIKRNKVYARILAEGAAEYSDVDIRKSQETTFTGAVNILSSFIRSDYESGKLELVALVAHCLFIAHRDGQEARRHRPRVHAGDLPGPRIATGELVWTGA